MRRRNFLKSATAAAVVGVILPTSNASASQDSKKEVIAHYVLFWLREDITEQEKADFTNFFEELRKVPNIKSLHYGGPANTTQRDVVDNSFTYNLLVYFDKMEHLDVYETHPIQLDAIEKYSKYWTKVAVHDSIL